MFNPYAIIITVGLTISSIFLLLIPREKRTGTIAAMALSLGMLISIVFTPPIVMDLPTETRERYSAKVVSATYNETFQTYTITYITSKGTPQNITLPKEKVTVAQSNSNTSLLVQYIETYTFPPYSWIPIQNN